MKDVDINNTSCLSSEIDKVINLFKNVSHNNEILIQKIINNVLMSGIIFNHALNYVSPYFVINYYRIFGLTNTFISTGNNYANRTLN